MRDGRGRWRAPWLRAGSGRRGRSSQRRSARPGAEGLEARALLAVELISGVPAEVAPLPTTVDSIVNFLGSHSLSPDGRHLIFQGTANGSVVMDLATGRETPIDVPVYTTVALSAGGRYAVYWSQPPRAGDPNALPIVVRHDLWTGEKTWVDVDIFVALVPEGIAVSSDGRYAAVTNDPARRTGGPYYRDQEILRVDFETRESVVASSDAQGRPVSGRAEYPSISDDGRYVTFQSSAPGLVPGDDADSVDVFRKDILTGAIVRVNVDAEGRKLGGSAWLPAMSRDGRYVAFTAMPGELDPLNPAMGIVYRKDLSTGAIVVANTTAGGVVDGLAGIPAISADGRYVAFWGNGAALVPGDTNGVLADLFTKDFQTGAIVRVPFGGAPSAAWMGRIALSADGSKAVYVARSGYRDAVPRDFNLLDDIVVADTQTGRARALRSGPASATGLGASNSGRQAVSADGRYVAFASTVQELTPGPYPMYRYVSNIYLRDRVAGTTTLITRGPEGGPLSALAASPAMSADSRYIAFYQSPGNVIPGDPGPGVFRYDRLTGATERVSRSFRAPGDEPGLLGLSLSADGRFVAYQDTHGGGVYDPVQVYVRDMLTGAVTLASRAIDGQPARRSSADPVLSADGRYVAFRSIAYDIAPEDANDVTDIFRHDLHTGEIVRVSVHADGSPTLYPSDSPAISADGRYVTFRTEAPLADGDAPGTSDIYRKDIKTGQLIRVTFGRARASAPAMTADGRYVAYRAVPLDAWGYLPSARSHIEIKDLETGEVVRLSADAGEAPEGLFDAPLSISAGGHVVSFSSRLGSLVPDDRNGEFDVFARTVPLFPPPPGLDADRVAENLPAGTVVGRLVGEGLSFELVGGEGGGDNARFRLEGATISLGSPLDFEERAVYSIRVRATNAAGRTTEGVVLVSAVDVNEPPTARDDSVATTDRRPVTIPVLDNDADPDSGDILEVIAVGQPARGSAAIGPDGRSVVYTPEPDAPGTFRFAYTVRDRAGHTATAVVVVEVVDASPPRLVGLRARVGGSWTGPLDPSAPLPVGTEAIELAFGEDVALAFLSPEATAFAYDPATRTARLELSAVGAVGLGRALAGLEVRDGTGNPLADPEALRSIRIESPAPPPAEPGPATPPPPAPAGPDAAPPSETPTTPVARPSTPRERIRQRLQELAARRRARVAALVDRLEALGRPRLAARIAARFGLGPQA